MVEVTETEEARIVAERIAGTNANVSHDYSNDNGRHQFQYSGKGCIQAHRLPDDWRFVGFSDSWFAIKKE